MRTQNKSFYHFKVTEGDVEGGGEEHYFRTAGDITKHYHIPKSSIYKQIQQPPPSKSTCFTKWSKLRIETCRLPIYQQIEINY